MKYFPLEVIDKLTELELEKVDKIFEQTVKEKTNQDIQIDLMGDPDFMNYCFGNDFLNPMYEGKYQILNDFLLYNKGLHKICLPGVKFSDLDQRQTEWRDMFGQSYALQSWMKSKVVYKIDHDFFHEIKQTQNLKFSNEMLSHLPVNTMYFDLSDVKGIGEFYGAWAHVHETEPNHYMLAIYMVMKENHAFFSYYCGFNFFTEEEIDYNVNEMLSEYDQTAYFYQDFGIGMDGSYQVVRHDLHDKEDYRPQIVTAICQILEFLHAQIEDVEESPITKSTYKPSTVIKNKFSEVRMWDVGVRYGKAIRFAKKQMAEEVKKAEQEQKNEIIINKKKRKPVRPHIRSAHWQRYHVGEGRKQIKVNWIPPTYVCGTKEIPVTIRKVGA